ncbi:hypothetical protein [Halapricum desulfuricans]|uniref:hypothetical protein n=1 Tax=Halapricum desulfuricans TaxID=2841257 RepID=UPI001E35320F|nr:hypothetical protein [Halapricum desulfuricans]
MGEQRESAKKAIVQGEFHLSNKDVSSLLDRDLEQWDTLLVEGREPVHNFENAKFGFGYYTIGTIFVRSSVLYVHKILDILGLASEDPIDDANIDTNKNIDAEHKEIWNNSSWILRWALLTLAAIGSIAVLIKPQFIVDLYWRVFYWWDTPFWYTYLLFFPGLPGLVHIFAVVNPTNSKARNRIMVENVVDYTADNDSEQVLILVGELHREGVAERLKDQGWSVESDKTNSKFGKLLTRVYRILGDWK